MPLFQNESAHTRRIFAEVQPQAQISKYLLFGRVVTMNATRDVLDDGVVGIIGRDIAFVGDRNQPRPPELGGALEVETGGTIYPGLIELHNHPAYNAIPLWDAPRGFTNRSQWRSGCPEYVRRVSNPATLIGKNQFDGDYPRAVARFVECKALFGGQTTFAGLSASDGKNYVGLVRNVEFPNQPGWPIAHGWINDFTSQADALKSIGAAVGDPAQPQILHLSEGTDQAARDVFFCLKKADDSGWLLAANILSIHAVGLKPEDFIILSQAGGLVWSPISNLLLYGETCKVREAKNAGIAFALGADWAPSGSKNLLGELKIARIVSSYQGDLFNDRELVEMVTCTPAAMMGWQTWLGAIAPRLRADLTIISGTSKSPYAQLIEAAETDVVAVLIDGRARYGRATLLDPASPSIEKFDVGGSSMLIDLTEVGTDPLGGFALSAAVDKLSYGFAHLPELAKQREDNSHLLAQRPTTPTLYLEFEDTGRHLLAAPPVIHPGDVDRMAIEPLTAVDDAGFVSRIKANPNIPDWLRTAI